MAEKGRLHTELLKALKDSASVASAQAVLEKFDSLYHFTVIYVDESKTKKIRADDLLRRVRQGRNEFVTSFWPEALTFLKDVRDFSLSDLPRAIDAVSLKLQDPQSVPSDWERHLRNLGRDVDAITGDAEALQGTLVDLEVKVRATKDELYRLANHENSDPVVAAEKEQFKQATATLAGVGVSAVVTTAVQWWKGADEPVNCLQSLNLAINCFSLTQSFTKQSLDDADEVLDPPIPHRGIILDEAESHLAEILSQLQALIEGSVVSQWKAVKSSVEMMIVQLHDSDVCRESALAELQEVKHLCNPETAPDTS